MATSPAPDPPVDPTICEQPVELLQTLVRFDTTNPPGHERPCIEWIEATLAAAGFATETYAADPDRPNLVARLDGTGSAPPLLCYGHVDVVSTADQDWTHPPFEPVVEDGFVWGRGTLDMKGGVAMMLAAALRAARAEEPLPADLMVMVLADEEAGGEMGAGYMVDAHPEVFADVAYAIGEFGGFSMELAGHRFYPIQLAEKAVCWSELTFTGPAGHGSRPITGGAMAAMARTISALDGTRLPVHVVPPVAELIESVAAAFDGEVAETVRGLTDPDRTDTILDELGDVARGFDPLLHNTATPTVVRGGRKENVIPAEVTLTLDCRLLPGQTPADLERELRGVIPDEVAYEFEPVRYSPVPETADDALFGLLADILESADPDGTAVPFVLPAGTDARHLTELDIQSYGFTPMQLPPDFDFLETIHAADERIPIEALRFGTERIEELLRRYGTDALST